MSNNLAPLWVAIKSMNFSHVQKELTTILQNGSSVDSIGPLNGQTPLHVACTRYYWNENLPESFLNQENVLKIVALLVENQPSIVQNCNNKGETSLMAAAAAGLYKVCKFLIDHGADINAECEFKGNTALHHAVFHDQIETVEFLLENEADANKKNTDGDDILQWTCLNLKTEFLKKLEQLGLYSKERMVNGYELIGSTFILSNPESCAQAGNYESAINKGIYFLTKAFEMRFENPDKPMLKNTADGSRLAYKNITEIQTLEELECVKSDKVVLRVQAILIYYRILGASHDQLEQQFINDTFIDPEKEEGFITIDGDLERYMLMLEINIKKYGFSYDIVEHMEDLIQYFFGHVNKFYNYSQEDFNRRDFCERVVDVMKFIVQELEAILVLDQTKKLTEEDKTFREFNLEVVLWRFPYFFYIFFATFPTPEELECVRNLTFRLNRAITVVGIPFVLLHKVCSDEVSYVSDKGSFYYGNLTRIFPSAKIAELLLQCGGDVNAVDIKKRSALHVVASHQKLYSEIIKVLIDHGGHIDQKDKYGDSVHELLEEVSYPINIFNYTTLKCLAAQVIKDEGIQYAMEIPVSLHKFIEMH